MFTYSGDPASSEHDYARFVVGDVEDVGHFFEDAEIDYLIAQYPPATADGKLRAALYRHAATIFSIKATRITLGPQTEEYRDRAKYFQSMADRAEAGSAFSGLPPLPNYDGPKVFYKGMMANA